MSLRRATSEQALGLGLFLALGSPVVQATDWVARLPSGAELAIVEDPANANNPYRLERRQPAAGLDRQFGQAGSVALNLGGETGSPSGLRVDAQGHIVVVGHVLPGNTMRMPVLLRFDARGQADARWATGGRAQITNFGADLAAEDALPLGDGKLLVLGTSEGKIERAVLWRLSANGQLDTGFGSGGWLSLRSDLAVQGISLAASGAAVMIGLMVTQSSGTWLEVHRWNPAQLADPVLVARQALPQNWVGLPVLEPRQDKCGWLSPADGFGGQRAWQPCQMLPQAQAVAWRTGPAPVAPAPEAVAPDAVAAPAGNEGSVAFSPYAAPPPTAPTTPTTAKTDTTTTAAPAAEPDSTSWLGWAAGVLAAAMVALWLALRRRSG